MLVQVFRVSELDYFSVTPFAVVFERCDTAGACGKNHAADGDFAK